MKINNVLSLFDGCSCLQVALNRAGIQYDNYFASEVDKYAISITQKNYPDTKQIGDIHFISGERLPKIDLLCGGSPCQNLSIAGDRKGLKGSKSKLFWEYVRVLREVKPKYFILENVASMKKEDREIITREMGVEPIMINSDRFVCQNRKRLFWTNIPVAKLPPRPNWNKQFYQWRRTHFRENKSGVCPTLTANMGTGGHNVPLFSKDKKDKLKPEHCEILQGLSNGYTSGISNTQRYKALGNGFTVDVIAHILKGIL